MHSIWCTEGRHSPVCARSQNVLWRNIWSIEKLFETTSHINQNPKKDIYAYRHTLNVRQNKHKASRGLSAPQSLPKYYHQLQDALILPKMAARSAPTGPKAPAIAPVKAAIDENLEQNPFVCS